MNMFAAIFYEEQRKIMAIEEAVQKKYKHLERKSVFLDWIKGFVCCKRKVNKRKDEYIEKNDGVAVGNLMERMKAAKMNRRKKKD
jgi:hypothetical protein